MENGDERVRVVVAEDNPTFRRTLVRLLQLDPGIEVAGEADNGKSALDLCLQLRPDVALLDFLMPELNGPEVTRALKQALPEVRVLVLSVFGQETFVSQAVDAGADAYLVKGLPADEVLAAVKGAAARHSQAEVAGKG